MTASRPSGPASRSATRSWRSCSIECCLELYAAGLVTGIQDLGAAGVSCATAELAAGGGGGMRRGPRRGAAARPGARPGRDPDERVAGTHDGRGRARPRRPVHGGLRPLGRAGHGHRRGHRHRPAADDLARGAGGGHPAGQRGRRGPGLPAAHRSARRARTRCWPTTRPRCPGPASGPELRATLLSLLRLARAGRQELGHRAVRPACARQHRARHAGGRRACSGSTSRPASGSRWPPTGTAGSDLLDPYAGAQLALAEAYRNVAATGAVPLAVTNCLNFGSPEDPGVMWQFSEAVRGLADGCAALGVPVTGGNVSFYNQTGEAPIHPTPVVGVLGVHADVTRRVPIGLRTEGARGRAARPDRGRVRRVGLGAGGARPLRRAAARGGPGRRAGAGPVLTAAAADGLLEAAHDLSEGGLAVALAECCLDQGARLPGGACRATCSPSCSASRRRAPWSRSGPAPSGPSPRWPPGTACRQELRVGTAGTASWCRAAGQPRQGSSPTMPGGRLAAAHRGTLPGLCCVRLVRRPEHDQLRPGLARRALLQLGHDRPARGRGCPAPGSARPTRCAAASSRGPGCRCP